MIGSHGHQDLLKAAGVLIRSRVTNDEIPDNSVTAAHVDQVVADIAAKYQNLTSDQLSAIKTRLYGMIGSGANHLRDLTAQGEQEASVYVAQNAQQQNLVPVQQAMQKLWADFNACEKQMQDEFEQLYKERKISYEQMQYMRAERKRLDALPQDSDERIADETTFAAYQKELGINIREQARKDGDNKTMLAADKVVGQADAQTKRLDQLYKLHVEGQKEKQQQIATLNNEKQSALNMLTDETPSLAAASLQDRQKMQVTTATHNDITTPFGGKDRTSDKPIVKT